MNKIVLPVNKVVIVQYKDEIYLSRIFESNN